MGASSSATSRGRARRFLFVPADARVQSRFAIVSLDTGDVLATPRFQQIVHGARFAARSPLVCVDTYGTPAIVAFPERAGGEVPARDVGEPSARGITSVGFDAAGEVFVLSHADGIIRC